MYLHLNFFHLTNSNNKFFLCPFTTGDDGEEVEDYGEEFDEDDDEDEDGENGEVSLSAVSVRSGPRIGFLDYQIKIIIIFSMYFGSGVR